MRLLVLLLLVVRRLEPFLLLVRRRCVIRQGASELLLGLGRFVLVGATIRVLRVLLVLLLVLRLLVLLVLLHLLVVVLIRRLILILVRVMMSLKNINFHHFPLGVILTLLRSSVSPHHDCGVDQPMAGMNE